MESNNQTLSLETSVEAILFKLNEPVSLTKLTVILGKEKKEVLKALENLKRSLIGRGVDLLQNNEEYSLVTAKSASSIIEKMVKDEMSSQLGRAGLETVSIVLYKGPLSRREIDYIRGVNSNFILRSLVVRGLVEGVGESKTSGGPLYRATSSLLSFLGISKINELPMFEKIRKEVEEVTKVKEESEND